MRGRVLASPKLPPDFSPFVDAVIERGWVLGVDGNHHPVRGAVSTAEAHVLASLILEQGCKVSLETGVATGISTLAMTQAIDRNDGHHYGIDPDQHTEHHAAAVQLLQEFNLQSRFTLCTGPAHLEAPRLVAEGIRVDIAFVDGMHTFDFKFIDWFFLDKLLKVGGFLIFHDILLPSMKKLYRYIVTKNCYEMVPTPFLEPSLYRKVRYTAAAFVKRRPYWYFWPNGYANLLVLRKDSEPDEPWNHFEPF